MNGIHLGVDATTGRRIWLDRNHLATHMHLIGATGAGKTTALLRILFQLMIDTPPLESCLFIIDPMGNLSRDLLNFLAHPTMCTDRARERLVYLEPSREDVVAPLNPLRHTTEGNRYYQVMRSMDIVLRAWDAQSLSEQPRLAQWMFNVFYSAAMAGVPISFCRYILRPESLEHKAILNRIPAMYRSEWQEIHRARGETIRVLESTRNRLRPFHVSPNLQRMFGIDHGRIDCAQFIRDRRIVVVNLGSYSQLPGRDAETIGGLLVNEIVEAANTVSLKEGRHVVEPTYLVMDEFQKFVSPDLEEALPTVRQMGLRLLLAHQSFSQLERGAIDLTQMIWQARSRLAFAGYARDADILADEYAKLTFDDMDVKHERYTTRQRIAGHRLIWLESQGHSESESRTQGRTTQQGLTESIFKPDGSRRSGRWTGADVWSVAGSWLLRILRSYDRLLKWSVSGNIAHPRRCRGTGRSDVSYV